MSARVQDVVVIGAGLAGSLAALGLRRRGLDVALVDARAKPVPEFRAEKMGVDEMAAFGRLGLDAPIRGVVTDIDEVWVARYGRRPVREVRREYGFAYHDLVGAVRAGGAVEPEIGKVVAIETTSDGKVVRLSDGRTIAARLVIVSTGLGGVVRKLAGVAVGVVSADHSLSLGFDLDQPSDAYRFGSLVAYSERHGDRSAYLTLFPIGSTMRGNLFVYRDVAEDWTRAFRADPSAGLARLVPKLVRWTAPLGVATPVALRPLDISRAEKVEQPGLLLIGDAFLTCCPVPGVGIPKVLTDVERLLHHAPGWFASAGMSAAKLASFYDDPHKRERDARSLRASLYARQMAVATDPVWKARRLRNAVVRHGAITAKNAVAAFSVAPSRAGARREAAA